MARRPTARDWAARTHELREANPNGPDPEKLKRAETLLKHADEVQKSTIVKDAYAPAGWDECIAAYKVAQDAFEEAGSPRAASIGDLVRRLEDKRKRYVPKGGATGTNVFALRDMFRKGEVDRVPNRIASVDAPHIRRCIGAGLARVEGTELVLTDAGKKAIADYMKKP